MTARLRRSAGEPSLAITETGRSDAPTLLLLHGVTRTHGDFAPLLPTLERSWRILAVDQRGHGDSARGHGYLVTDYVADAVGLVRAETTWPLVILGHSLGAMVAAGVAAAVPDRVHGIVLEDPPFDAMGGRIAGTAWQAQFTGMREAAERGGTIEELAAALAAIALPSPHGDVVRLGAIRDAAAIHWSATCLARLDPAVLTPVVAGRWLAGYDMHGVAAAIRCPVRLLQADPKAGGALSDSDRDTFAATVADCTVERFTGAGHLLHWTHPAAVAAAVDGLLPRRVRDERAATPSEVRQ